MHRRVAILCRVGIENFRMRFRRDELDHAKSEKPPDHDHALAEFHAWDSRGHSRCLTAAAPLKIDMPGVMLTWKVLVRQPESRVIKLVHELQQAVSIVILCSIALFVVIAWFLSRWIGRPIHQFLNLRAAMC